MATIKEGKGTFAIAAFDKTAALKPVEFGRPEPGPNDVSIKILYCGMCHSDLHACNGDWGMEFFPIAPGHEIAGEITKVGSSVTEFKVGDKVGVGCFVESCRDCAQCSCGSENHCLNGVTMTYGSVYKKGNGHDDCAGYHTNGGYSSAITVAKKFVFHAPKNIGLEYVAPLLCAGITMYAPLNEHVLNGKKAKKVGIIGFGGLGQMGVKLAKAMGCEVTVFSRSTSKKPKAEELGAGIIAHTDGDAMNAATNQFDLLIDTIAVSHDISKFFPALNVAGVYHFIGAVPTPASVSPFAVLAKKLKIGGSLVGGMPETQEMLDFCAKHNITPNIRIIHAKEASAHFEAMHNGASDAERTVIDMTTLPEVTE